MKLPRLQLVIDGLLNGNDDVSLTIACGVSVVVTVLCMYMHVHLVYDNVALSASFESSNVYENVSNDCTTV